MFKSAVTIAKFLINPGIVFILLHNSASAQEIVTDTITIEFRCDTLIPVDYFIQSVKDNRKVNPKVVGYSQKKKYILLPVDQEICTKKNLAEYFRNSNLNLYQPDTFLLDLDYFVIEKYGGRYYNPYILKADIPVTLIKSGIPAYIGTLSYNYEYKPVGRKIPKPEVYSQLLENWYSQYKIDFISLNSYLNGINQKPENLIETKLSKSHFCNVWVGAAAGLNFWQLDGEICFTRPETQSRQRFISGIIRYQNTRDFEMISFGKKSEHIHKRLSEKTVLDVSTHMLIGLNKWKYTNDKKLEQIMQFSASSSQSINFDKVNQHGWLLKAGLFENCYYIIYQPLHFQFGLYLSLGYKF